MLELIPDLANLLPPLPRSRNPKRAALIGLLTGGVGLALYFRTVLDIAAGLLITAVVMVVGNQLGLAGLTWLVSGAVWAFWGFLRAEASNRRLHVAPTAPAAAHVAAQPTVGPTVAGTQPAPISTGPESRPAAQPLWATTGSPVAEVGTSDTDAWWTTSPATPAELAPSNAGVRREAHRQPSVQDSDADGDAWWETTTGG